MKCVDLVWILKQTTYQKTFTHAIYKNIFISQLGKSEH